MSFKLCDSCLHQGIRWDCGVWEGGVFTCSRCGTKEERLNPISPHTRDQIGRVDIGPDDEDPPSVEEQLSAALAYVVSTFSEISHKGHRTGYDWNADPENLTLLGSTIFEARYEPEGFLARRDTEQRKAGAIDILARLSDTLHPRSVAGYIDEISTLIVHIESGEVEI